MKLNEHKELKKEILALPPKEKDKLLLRLVAKDKVLTEHLHFLLLEDGSDLVDRVETIKQNISKTLQSLGASKSTTAKEVLANLRSLAKQVNHNFRVTKAAFEDVELRIFLFNNSFSILCRSATCSSFVRKHRFFSSNRNCRFSNLVSL
jgi:hypothetical protein